MTCGAPGRRPFRPSPFPVIQRAETDLNVARGVTSRNLPELPRRPWEAGTSLSCVVPALPRPAAGRVSTRREWTQLRPPPAACPVREPGRQVWGAGPPGRGTCTPARPSHVGRPSDAHASGPPNDGTRGPRGAAAASGENAVRGGQALREPRAAAESGCYAERPHHGEHAAKTPPESGGRERGAEPEQRVRTPHGQRGLTCLPAPSPSSGTR